MCVAALVDRATKRAAANVPAATWRLPVERHGRVMRRMHASPVAGAIGIRLRSAVQYAARNPVRIIHLLCTGCAAISLASSLGSSPTVKLSGRQRLLSAAAEHLFPACKCTRAHVQASDRLTGRFVLQVNEVINIAAPARDRCAPSTASATLTTLSAMLRRLHAAALLGQSAACKLLSLYTSMLRTRSRVKM